MTRPAGSGEGRESLFAALKNIAATLIDTVRSRTELLVTEVEEEKYRLIALGAKAFGAAALLVVGVILAVASLAMAFWEQRVAIFGVFSALFLVAALLIIRGLKREAEERPPLFHATLSELRKDVRHLRGHRETPERQ